MWKRCPGVAILLLNSVIGLAHAQQNPGVYDGSWSGSTSQEKQISFKVSGDAVTQLNMEWRLPLDRICVTEPGSQAGLKELGGIDSFYFEPNSPGSKPARVMGNKLRLVKENFTHHPVHINLTLTGDFASSREVSGTLELTTVACKGYTKVEWKARREQKTPGKP